MKNKKRVLLTISNVLFGSCLSIDAMADGIPKHNPADNSNQAGTITFDTTNGVITNGDNGYKNIGPFKELLLEKITIKELVNNGNIDKDSEPYKKILRGAEIDLKKEKIEVKDRITGEVHSYSVYSSDSNQKGGKLIDHNYSDDHLVVWKGRQGLDYVDHTIAKVSNGKTLEIKQDDGLTDKWYDDEKHQLQAGHRQSHVYVANSGATINYKDKVNIQSGWLPSYEKNSDDIIQVGMSIGTIKYWNGKFTSNGKVYVVNNVDDFKSMNNELIKSLKNGEISYLDYQKTIKDSYTDGYVDFPYKYKSKDDPIFKSPLNSKNGLLYGEGENTKINIEKDASILISNGQYSAVNLDKGAKATNNGEITALETYLLSAININDKSTFINDKDGVISHRTSPNNKYRKNKNVSSNNYEGVNINNNSIFSNRGIMNGASAVGMEDEKEPHAIAVTHFRMQNLVNLDHSKFYNEEGTGIINFATDPVSILPDIAKSYAIYAMNKSDVINNGMINIGKQAQASRDDKQADVKIKANENKAAAIFAVDNSFIQNKKNATININKTVENFNGIQVAGSKLVTNEGTILVDGVNNKGIFFLTTHIEHDSINQGSYPGAEGDSHAKNTGLIKVGGVGNKRIYLSSVDDQYSSTASNTGEILLQSQNSFKESKKRNYGVWVEGEKSRFDNKGHITLQGSGNVGVHARKAGKINIEGDKALARFITGDSQIGYFAYGKGSDVVFNNITASNDVNTKESTFARIEDGAKIAFNNKGKQTKINLIGANTVGFHIAGKGTSFTGDKGLEILLDGDKSNAFLASNGGEVEIKSDIKALLVGDSAIFAIADGATYNIDGTISKDVSDVPSVITSNAILNDENAKGKNIVGYHAKKGGKIIHNGYIELITEQNPTGISIDGGDVVNNGNIKVKGTGVHIIGEGSKYSTENKSTLIDVIGGKAGIWVDKNAGLTLTNAKVENSGGANGILIDKMAKKVTIDNATVIANDSGSGIYNQQNNADGKLEINHSTIEAMGKNAAIYNHSNKGYYQIRNASNINARNVDAAVIKNSDLAGSGYSATLDNSEISGSIITPKGTTSNITLDNNSKWNVLHSKSNVTNLNNGNKSVINLTKENFKKNSLSTDNFNTLVVGGKYKGGDTQEYSNGKLIVSTVWNNDASASDLLHIKGKASGYTEVATKDTSIFGNVTKGNVDKYSADVVKVDDHQEDSNNFYGFADTTGAAQAILKQKDKNTYAWYLAGEKTPEPVPPVDPIRPVPPVDPIRPEVPGYVQMARGNLEMGYLLNGTLHERVGEQQTMAWDDCSQCQVNHNNGQAWARLLGKDLTVDGKNRFGFRSKISGIQVGYDFNINYNADKDSRIHSGILATFLHGDHKFSDQENVTFNEKIGDYVSNKEQTGTGKTDMFALGAYNTFYAKNGSYLDLVGHLVHTKNEYKSMRAIEADNKGYGAILSAEAGRPLALTQNGINNGDWLLEPQAQLTYQYLHANNFSDDGLNKFNDSTLKIDQKNNHSLRGRLGVRLAYNSGNNALKTKSIYLTANVLHDFMEPKPVTIGTDEVEEKYKDTWGEVGIGLQFPVGKQSYIYADTRYEHSFGSKSNGRRSASTGTIGYKYYW